MPVFSFGEHVVYDQVTSEPDSRLYRFQETLRKYIGMAPVVIRGRGMFQYSFGLLPHRSPVTVVGKSPFFLKMWRKKPEEPSFRHCF